MSTDSELIDRLRDRYIDGAFFLRLLAAARIEALSRALAEAEKQRDEALREVEDYLEPHLRSLNIESGEFRAELAGKAVEAMALSLVSTFKEGGATNYIEMSVFDRADPFQRYVVTVQKAGKLSPHEKADAAEAKLRVAVEVLRLFADYPVGSISMGEDGYVMTLAVGGQQPTFADFARARAALSSIGEV
jgi:hypothetical protein